MLHFFNDTLAWLVQLKASSRHWWFYAGLLLTLIKGLLNVFFLLIPLLFLNPSTPTFSNIQ